MYCLDANVWIYYLDDTLEEHDAVVDLVRDIVQSEPLFITTVLQMEVIHYFYTQQTDPSDLVERFLYLEDVTVAELRPEDVDEATKLLREHRHTGIGGRDATVLAAMRRHDVSHLLTHDNGFKRIEERLGWLEVTDPVSDSR